MACKSGDCYKALCWEFHVSRFCLCHHNWKYFAFTPWLPESAYFQWIYLVYRWILVVFFALYCLWGLVISEGYFFIYLTNWGATTLTCYMLWSGIFVTFRFVTRHCSCIKWKPQEKDVYSKQQLARPGGCCGTDHNSLKWFDYIHWLLFTLASEAAVMITILYWTLLYTAGNTVNHFDVALHLLNGIVAFLDLWVTRIPVRIYHLVYTMCFSATYSVFTGIYFAADGGNRRDNGTYIYPVLDYENTPGSATGLVIATNILFTSLVHLFMYLNYLLREGLLHILAKRNCCHHQLQYNTNDTDEKAQPLSAVA